MSDGKRRPRDRAREPGPVELSSAQGRGEVVLQLLAGEHVDTVNLDYDLDAWHLGLIAIGAEAEQAVQHLADGLGRQYLSVRSREGILWAWLGGQARIDIADVTRRFAAGPPTGASLALGETRPGVDGWRVTHREAQATLPVARLRPGKLTRCVDFLLEAVVLQDQVAVQSLLSSYLQPLDDLHNGGLAAHETLRAYFSSNRNARATAVAMDVSPQTIQDRLSAIEICLERPLHACHAELEVALRLRELDGSLFQNAALEAADASSATRARSL